MVIASLAGARPLCNNKGCVSHLTNVFNSLFKGYFLLSSYPSAYLGNNIKVLVHFSVMITTVRTSSRQRFYESDYYYYPKSFTGNVKIAFSNIIIPEEQQWLDHCDGKWKPAIEFILDRVSLLVVVILLYQSLKKLYDRDSSGKYSVLDKRCLSVKYDFFCRLFMIEKTNKGSVKSCFNRKIIDE